MISEKGNSLYKADMPNVYTSSYRPFLEDGKGIVNGCAEVVDVSIN